MRTLLSALLALLALTVTAGGLASAWLDENLVEEAGFVALAAPLGDDAEFQSTLTDAIAQEVAVNAGLPESLNSVVEPLIRDTAGAVTGSSGYPAAWSRTLRVSHAVTFARAPDPSQPAPAIITLDLGPVIGLVSDNLAGPLGVDVPLPEDTTIEVGTIERGGIFSSAAETVQSWPLYLAAAAVLAVLAVVIARRRGTTVALLGMGVVVIGVLGLLAADWLPAAAVRLPGTNPVADVFIRGLADRAGSDIAAASLPVIVGGVVALGLGVAVQVAFGRRRRA